MRRIAIWFVLWTVIGVVFALPELDQGSLRLSRMETSLADWWAWGLLAPIIVAIETRFPLFSALSPSRFVIHLAAGSAAAFLHVGLRAVLVVPMGVGPLPSPAGLWREAVHGGILWGLIVYFLLYGLWSAQRANKRQRDAELALARAEHSLTEARLVALRAQLDPHFLFNALNTISSQVTVDARSARRMIEHLGDLLRLSLETSDRQSVPLSEEVAFLDNYLILQRMRFGDRLSIDVEIAPDARSALVPSLILQPLVENAIRHGLALRLHGGSVRIEANIIGDKVVITVSDDGVGLPATWSGESDYGTGLTVTCERLFALHGRANTYFRLTDRQEGGVAAEISLPLVVS